MKSLLRRLVGGPAQTPVDATAEPAFLDDIERETFEALQSRLDRLGTIERPNLAACAAHFRKRATVLAQLRTARGHLSHLPEPRSTRGLDLACWCGFMTWMLRRLGPAEVWGADVIPEHVDAARWWTERCGETGLAFRANDIDRLPFEDDTFDWVVTSGLYSNLNPEATVPLFGEVRRVLVADGWLLFNDGGNILHPPTRDRIARRYAEVEAPPGPGRDRGGEFHANRRELLALGAPLSDADLDRLTAETCYLWGESLARAKAHFLDSGETPGSRFEPDAILQPPVDPERGNAAARANDPLTIRAELEEAGFRVEFTQGAGGPPVRESELESTLAGGAGIFAVARPHRRTATSEDA